MKAETIEDVEYEEVYTSSIDRFNNTLKITYIDFAIIGIHNLIFTTLSIAYGNTIEFSIFLYFTIVFLNLFITFCFYKVYKVIIVSLPIIAVKISYYSLVFIVSSSQYF